MRLAVFWKRPLWAKIDRELAKIKKGLGIVSMEERVRLVVGTLNIRSRPGDGTRVAVEVPLPEAVLPKRKQ